MAGIRLKDIHKTYQVDDRTFPVLNGVDLEIPEGKITVILGQSGCGKTTLLRLTGGLESADSGEVLWDGAHKTAFVFQEPRLMPWLNVWNNIIFGLKKNQVNQEKIQDIVSTVNLSGFEKAYPSQLSGPCSVWTIRRPSIPAACNSARLSRGHWHMNRPSS